MSNVQIVGYSTLDIHQLDIEHLPHTPTPIPVGRVTSPGALIHAAWGHAAYNLQPVTSLHPVGVPFLSPGQRPG